MHFPLVWVALWARWYESIQGNEIHYLYMNEKKNAYRANFRDINHLHNSQLTIYRFISSIENGEYIYVYQKWMMQSSSFCFSFSVHWARDLLHAYVYWVLGLFQRRCLKIHCHWMVWIDDKIIMKIIRFSIFLYIFLCMLLCTVCLHSTFIGWAVCFKNGIGESE